MKKKIFYIQLFKKEHRLSMKTLEEIPELIIKLNLFIALSISFLITYEIKS